MWLRRLLSLSINYKQRSTVTSHFPVKLLGSDTFPPDTVRNLGVVFDSDFNFRQYISQVRKSCFYHIRDLRRSPPLISNRLDYCNSLLNNIAKRDLATVQHCLARVVLRAPRFSPSLPLLQQLHWLPVTYRIHFKLSTLTYPSNNHPTWLISCIFQISIGSSDHQFHNLLCLKQNLTWVNVLRSVATPRVWNELRITLKTSKTIVIFREKPKDIFILTYISTAVGAIEVNYYYCYPGSVCRTHHRLDAECTFHYASRFWSHA